MKTKLLTFFLVLVTYVGTISASVVIDGIAYDLNATNLTASVTSGEDYSGSVVIPNSVTYENQVYDVTCIKSTAFRECYNLTSISIPNSVKRIEDHIFYRCTSLTTIIWNTNPTFFNRNSVFADVFWDLRPQITSFIFGDDVNSIPESICEGMTQLNFVAIGNSVTSIGNHAFDGCTSLISMNIPNNVIDIGEYAFRNCTSMTSVTIPNSVTSIGDLAFEGCSGLTSVTIPNSVTSIGDLAFEGCRGLTSVTIPNSVTSIRSGAFFGCSINEIHFNGTIKDWCEKSWGARILQSNYKLFIGDLLLTDLVIPNSVTSIGSGAFYGCNSLTSIKVIEGNSVYDSRNNCNAIIQTTNNELIVGCMNTTIPNSVTSIGDSAFFGCIRLATITVPNSITIIGNSAFSRCDSLTSVTIDQGVTTIEHNVFDGCRSLTSIEIPYSVTNIGINVFRGCNSLSSIYWDANINSDYSANNTPFYSDKYVWDIRPQINTFVFGDSIKHIPAYLCAGMTNLKHLTIGSSIPDFSANDFAGCNNISNVTIKSNAVAGKTYSTSNNLNSLFGSQVTEYIFGGGVTALGAYALYNTANVDSITIAGGMVSIGTNAFDNCPRLTKVTIKSDSFINKNYSSTNNFATIFGSQVKTYVLGDSITSIGDYAFYNCSNVTTLNIPQNVASIGQSSFYGCTGISSLNIPQSVTNIGNHAFEACIGVDSLKLPNITYIGNSAFAECTNISSLQLGNSLTHIGDSAFSSCYNIPIITLPNNLQTIGSYAFYQCNKIPNIVIPSSVTSLGVGVFKSCTKLTDVTINSNAVISKTYTPTSNLSTIFGLQVQSFTLDDAITVIGDYAFCNTNITSLTIPENVVRIGSHAFQNCVNITSISIPQAINSIEDSTFYGCTALASMKLPNVITTIKDNAFANCSSLQLDSLPTAITTLGANAFFGCASMASISIPASLKTIGENAFKGCVGISKVEIDDLSAWCKIDFANSHANPMLYAQNLYLGDTLLTKLEIPNKITELKPWTFNNCSSLQVVNISNTINAVAPTAFANCANISFVEWHAKNIIDYTSSAGSPFHDSRNKIKEFIWGEEVEHIPAYLCYGMSGIKDLALPSYLKSVGKYAFRGLTKINKVNIPNEVSSIGAYAFDSCIFVTSIYLGYLIEDIGNYAFNGCSRVNDITCMSTVTPVVYEKTLSSISSLAYLYVQAGSKRTYQLDPYWGRFDIQEIATDKSTLTKDDVTIEANDDNAVFTWPIDSTAATYSLQITKDGEVFCTLIFNSIGQLVGIAFAPSRNGSPHATAATTSIAGMSFTVTGLNTATRYGYNLTTKNDQQQVIKDYSGRFATQGYVPELFTIKFVNWDSSELQTLTNVEEFTKPEYTGATPTRPTDQEYSYTFAGWAPEIVAACADATYTATYDATPVSESVEEISSEDLAPQKVMIDGQIFILRGEKVYTLQGQEVR